MKLESNKPSEGLIKLSSDLETDVSTFIKDAIKLGRGLIGRTTYPRNPTMFSSDKLIIRQEGLKRFEEVADLLQRYSSDGSPEYSHILLGGYRDNEEVIDKIRKGLIEKGLDELTHPQRISKEGALSSMKLIVQRRARGLIVKDGKLAIGETGALISVQSELLGGSYREFTVNPEILAQNPERGITLIDGIREILKDVWPFVEKTFPNQSESIGKIKYEDRGTIYREFEIF